MSQQTDDFAAGAQALADAVQTSASDPGDAIRMLLPLCAWIPMEICGTGALSTEARFCQEAIAANLRMAACAALGEATRLYRPWSYQDAQALRKVVSDALEAEATRSADAGRTDSFQALRDLRAAVALDLALRGADLAFLIEIEERASMPSLTEAWRLYQDTTREPELVRAADVIHPLFMPVSFQALSR
jgi:prophage DNA circulation protein